MSPAQRNRIDDLLRQLWLELRAAAEDMPAADLDLFDQITAHEAVQSRLRTPPPAHLKQPTLNLS